MNRAADWLIGRWLEGRFNFAMHLREGRTSLAAALILVLRLGLPMTAFFVALNPDLGFQLVFQHGKLGDRRLPKDDAAAGRSLAH